MNCNKCSLKDVCDRTVCIYDSKTKVIDDYFESLKVDYSHPFRLQGIAITEEPLKIKYICIK